jgi:hypothetical protein
MISRNWATNGHMGAVEPFVFRKPCTNDLIVSQEKSFRHAHIHLTEYEMTRRMSEAVSEGFRLASSVLNGFLKTREDRKSSGHHPQNCRGEAILAEAN